MSTANAKKIERAIAELPTVKQLLREHDQTFRQIGMLCESLPDDSEVTNTLPAPTDPVALAHWVGILATRLRIAEMMNENIVRQLAVEVHNTHAMERLMTRIVGLVEMLTATDQAILDRIEALEDDTPTYGDLGEAW